MRAEVVIHGAGNAPEIDAPVAVEIFIFDGDQSVAQDFGDVVVLHGDPSLQREGTDDLSLVVVKFGGSAGSITLKFTDLWKISRVNDEEPGQRAHQGSRDDQQRKYDAAHEFLSRKAHGRQVGIQVFNHGNSERK